MGIEGNFSFEFSRPQPSRWRRRKIKYAARRRFIGSLDSMCVCVRGCCVVLIDFFAKFICLGRKRDAFCRSPHFGGKSSSSLYWFARGAICALHECIFSQSKLSVTFVSVRRRSRIGATLFSLIIVAEPFDVFRYADLQDQRDQPRVVNLGGCDS